MNYIQPDGISIQVSLSGFSFKIGGADAHSSSWLGADRIFNTPELQRSYSRVEIALLTPKCTLVPTRFFDPARIREALSDVVDIRPQDEVCHIQVPAYDAELIYSNSIDEALSRALAHTVSDGSGKPAQVLPEMYFILRDLQFCPDYNKILVSYKDGWLHLAIGQGRTLLLANTFRAVDFTTAEYFIFNALHSLQLNPEMSTVCFRTHLEPEEELSLYRYFKDVAQV